MGECLWVDPSHQKQSPVLCAMDLKEYGQGIVSMEHRLTLPKYAQTVDRDAFYNLTLTLQWPENNESMKPFETQRELFLSVYPDNLSLGSVSGHLAKVPG